MTLDTSYRNLRVPDTIDSGAVKKAGAEHARLLKMYSETGRELGVAQAARHAAVEQDRREYADALAASKKDPGTKHTDAADERLAQIKRKHEALELAITEAHAAVTEAVVDGRADLLEVAKLDVSAAAQEYRDAVDTLAGAHARLAGAVSTRSWLLRFPEATSIPRSLHLVRDLPRDRNGESYDAQTVIAALRAVGDVPDPVLNSDGSLSRGLHVVDAAEIAR